MLAAIGRTHLGGAGGDGQAGQRQHDEQRQDADRAHDAQFLARDGVDEVGGGFRQVAELLDAIAKATPGQTAAGDGRHALDHVVALALGILVGIHVGHDAVHAVRTGDHQSHKRRTRRGQQQTHVPQAHTSGHQHAQRHHHDQHRSAQILHRHQRGDETHQRERRHEALPEGAQRTRATAAMPRHDQRHAPLGDLAGLQADGSDGNPAVGAIHLATDARHMHQHQTHDDGSQQPRNGAGPATAREDAFHPNQRSKPQEDDRRHREHGVAADQQLLNGGARAAGRGQAGAVHQHGAGHQQGDHQKQQSLSGAHGTLIIGLPPLRTAKTGPGIRLPLDSPTSP